MTPKQIYEAESHASEPSSRNRLLASAKSLFSVNGYESTSTAAIARRAGTSESQLIKHFGGKAGLLEAIFVEGWQHLASATEEVIAHYESPVDKIRCIPNVVLAGLGSDPELRLLMLLEGRRIRRDVPVVALTEGFLRFVKLIDNLLAQVRDAGRLRPDVNLQAIRSALMGMLEGGMRDQLLAERGGFPAEFTTAQLLQSFHIMLAGLLVD